MAIVTYSQRDKVLMVKLTKAIKIKQSELKFTLLNQIEDLL